MRSLDQIESRTPISSIPYVINTPGSYYLTSDLKAPDDLMDIGILIATNDVTIDLNGFTLVGSTSSWVGIFGGPFHPNTKLLNNVMIRNGSVNGWPFGGVDLRGVRSALVEYVHVEGNGNRGIECSGVVRHCVAISNENVGIRANGYSIVSDCTASATYTGSLLGDGFYGGTIIRNCRALGNEISGIRAGAITKDCIASENMHGVGVGSASLAMACVANENRHTGIRMTGAESMAINNTANLNATNGMHIYYSHCYVADNTVVSNETGIGFSTTLGVLARNTARGNSAQNYDVPAGIRAGPIDSGSGPPTNHPWANFEF